VSNPKLSILDTLSKFSHDSDSEVAHNAIFAMGLVGAGTNNARYLFSATFYKGKVKLCYRDFKLLYSIHFIHP
jgi:hypothetical protein